MRLPRLRLPRFLLPAPNKGAEQEEAALRFLLAQGLAVTCAVQLSCRVGEIDLIMQQGNAIVFVEVRFRASRTHGGAAASVTASKQRKLRLTASHYLQSQQLNEARQPCRFDVVAYEGDGQCQWYINAFQGRKVGPYKKILPVSDPEIAAAEALLNHIQTAAQMLTICLLNGNRNPHLRQWSCGLRLAALFVSQLLPLKTERPSIYQPWPSPPTTP